MNKAQLSMGEITFGRWKNKDQKDILRRVYVNKFIADIKDKELREKLYENDIKEWLVTYSIFRGEGILKCPTIEETFNAVQELDVVDTKKLGEAFNKFFTTEIENLKKK